MTTKTLFHQPPPIRRADRALRAGRAFSSTMAPASPSGAGLNVIQRIRNPTGSGRKITVLEIAIRSNVSRLFVLAAESPAGAALANSATVTNRRADGGSSIANVTWRNDGFDPSPHFQSGYVDADEVTIIPVMVILPPNTHFEVGVGLADSLTTDVFIIGMEWFEEDL